MIAKLYLCNNKVFYLVVWIPIFIYSRFQIPDLISWSFLIAFHKAGINEF